MFDPATFIFQLFWMILIFSMFIPFMRSASVKSSREALLRSIE